MTTVYRVAGDDCRLAFLRSLADDLRLLDNDVRVWKRGGRISFKFTPNDLTRLPTEQIITLYQSIRNRRLIKERDFIENMEKGGVLELISDGGELNLELIRPEISICASQKEKDLYRYCRKLQSVPTSRGVGRRIYGLVYDKGQRNDKLMGVIGLASPIYSLRDRDEYLKWSTIDSISHAKQTRHTGLRRIMQLSVCMALPPYNYLYGGKLIAMLALTDPIQSEFQRKYNDPLLGLTTTSVAGLHAPIFNRLRTNRVDPSDKYGNYANELYKRIGKTSVFSTIMLSDSTFELARTLYSIESDDSSTPVRGIRSSVSKSQSILKAFSLCGVNSDLLRTHVKGLYFACLTERNLRILSSIDRTDDKPAVEFDIDDVFNYWKDQWLSRALGRKSILEQVHSFESKSIALSNFFL